MSVTDVTVLTPPTVPPGAYEAAAVTVNRQEVGDGPNGGYRDADRRRRGQPHRGSATVATAAAATTTTTTMTTTATATSVGGAVAVPSTFNRTDDHGSWLLGTTAPAANGVTDRTPLLIRQITYDDDQHEGAGGHSNRTAGCVIDG